MIDWDRFSTRVPAGTRVKAHKSDNPKDDIFYIEAEGIVLQPDMGNTDLYFNPGNRESTIEVQFFYLVETVLCHKSDLEYLIDGTWLSYAQIMEG